MWSGGILRLRLSLKVDSRENILPLNYQYPVSAWIYQRIARANPEFANWIHNTGYRFNSKNFKLFTFSNFHVPRRNVQGDRLHILSPQVYLNLSFYVEKAVESFIIGLFQNQEFEIGDRISKARFQVTRIESLPEPSFISPMEFQCLSPICVSRSTIRKGKKMPEYLAPTHTEYERIFFDNLVFKYIALRRELESRDEFVHTEEGDFRFELLSEPRSRLITIKTGQPDQTRVRGYFYTFRIFAPPELMRIGYYAGFGEKNSLGFGYVEVKKNEGTK